MKSQSSIYSRVLLLAAAFIFVLTACSKDDDPAADKKSMLVGGKWTFSSGTAEDELVQGLLISLYQGSTFTFNTNGSYDGEYGDFVENLPFSGTWELINNDTKITFDKGTDEEKTWDIVTLDSDTFSFKDADFTLVYSK